MSVIVSSIFHSLFLNSFSQTLLILPPVSVLYHAISEMFWFGDLLCPISRGTTLKLSLRSFSHTHNIKTPVFTIFTVFTHLLICWFSPLLAGWILSVAYVSSLGTQGTNGYALPEAGYAVGIVGQSPGAVGQPLWAVGGLL